MARSGNSWGYPQHGDGRQVGLPPVSKLGSGSGVGRKAKQTDDESPLFSGRSMTLPLDFIGPAIDAVGAFTLPSELKFLKLEGGKATLSPMMPPDIPLPDDQKEALARYLERELGLAEGERHDQIRKMARLKAKYRTKYPELPKDYPIANSSQLTVPVIKTAHDTISSRVYQTVAAADPKIRVKTEDEQFSDFGHDYEEYLREYGDYIDLDDVLSTHIDETCLLGTGVVEATNWRDVKSTGQYDPQTGAFKKVTQTCHSGPTVFVFPIEDFWIRPSYPDLQKAPWCGKELRLTWSQIKDMALAGELNPEALVKIAKFENGDREVPETVIVDEWIEKFKPNRRGLYSLFELAVRWDVDGDGLEEELIVYFHRQSRTLARIKFNNFYRSRRPWIASWYKKLPHRFYGEGIAESLEHLQEEISTIHNQRIDNATIAALRIILVNKTIQGLRPGDRLWSGKIVKVSDVSKDVGTLQLGEIYPSTVNNEQISQNYVHELSGAGQVAMGQAQPVSRTTATAQMALLEELNRRFDKPLRNFRRTVRQIHIHLSDMFLEQGTGGLAEQWLGPVRGRRVEQFLQMPPELINKKLKMKISATKSTNNREIDFQTQVAVMNLVIQQGERMLAMVQQLAPQHLPMVAHELITTIKPIFRKVMAYAEAGDPDQAVAVLSVLERILPAPEDMGGMATARAQEMASMAAGPGAGGVAGGPGGPPGAGQLEELARMVSSTRQNGQGNGGRAMASPPSTAY